MPMDCTIDATGKKLGRLASEVASILQDKDCKVIIKNIDKLNLDKKKLETKIYKHHTGYIGHLKQRALKEMYLKAPAWVFRHAVKGMLPKNKLLPKRLKKLVIE